MVIDDKYYEYRVKSLSTTEQKIKNAVLRPFDLEVGEIIKVPTRTIETDDSGRQRACLWGVSRYRVLEIYDYIIHCVLLDDKGKDRYKESFRKLDFQLGEIVRDSEELNDSRTKTQQS